MFYPVLKYYAAVDQSTRKATKEAMAIRLGLTSEEMGYKTSSGVAVYESRVGWAISRLDMAGYLDRIGRGLYKVTDAGKAAAAQDLDATAFGKMVCLIKSPVPSGEPLGATQDAGEETLSPSEAAEKYVDLLNESLGNELLQIIMDHSPAFFEKLVVDLLQRMGYGKGVVTQYSGDGGIDGIIATDPLGFNPIYTQAKRFNPSTSIGSKEIQAFAGALGSAKRGAFMTTARFTEGAKKFAQSFPHADIVLIDGKKLTELMIKFNLGVATEKILEVKRMDSDYFEEG